ncbi:MAG: DUF4349 domain-containing protein [Candidatus Limnocylindrus sp.]
MNMRNALITRLGLPTALGAILALALALVAGLGGAGGSSVSSGTPDLLSSDVGKEMGAGGVAPQFGDTVTANRGDGTRDVVRYGSLSLEVEDADDALERVTAIAERVGGYITSSSRSGEGENLYLSATLRVPVAEFSSVMAALRDEGEILYEDIGSYEVTLAVLDLEARLENLRASEDAFLALLDRAESVADVVAVQSELSRIQGDIESYEAQLNGMKDQVEMASITVSLSLPVSPVEVATGEFDLAYELSNALANLINVGRAVIVALINILVIGAPIALLGGLFGSLIGRAARMLASKVSRMFGGTSKGTRRVARR